MCNVNNLGLGIGMSNILSEYGQRRADTEYQKARNSLIMEQFRRQSRDLNNSYAQEQRNNSLQKQQNYIRNLQAKSTLLASKASSGVNGNSVENLFRGFDRSQAVNNYLSARDLNNRGLIYDDKLSSLRYSAINSLTDLSQYRYRGASTLLNGFSNLLRRSDRQQ